MTDYLFPPAPQAALRVRGQSALYPVTRIFCVGRNYAAHAAEMGNEVDREAPFYFTKTPAALVPSDSTIPYPPGTSDYHHEMELVVAIGAPSFQVPRDQAGNSVFGYACGLDMTRRDLQGQAKDKRRPWDIGKDFENSAIVGQITPAKGLGDIGAMQLCLGVNGQIRQQAMLSDMVWSVPEIIAHLSTLYHLAPGDIIFTGTPAGVGPVLPGDLLSGSIGGLDPITLTISPDKSA